MQPLMVEAMLGDASPSFSGLSSGERRHLREWQVSARAIKVDGVEDLTLRPWPCEVQGTVIGIFTSGSKEARWLVVGEGGFWAVACCMDGKVSQTLNSLAEALVLIYPVPAVADPPLI